MNGDTLYAWQELDGTGWGVIAELLVGWGGIVGTGPTSLVTRNREIAEAWRAIAEAHGRASGNRVRLARFELTKLER